MILELSISPHDQYCIQVENPSKDLRDLLRSIVMNNRIDSDDYKITKAAGAFLQCDYEEYVLIEFWRIEGAEAFVEYCNFEIMRNEIVERIKSDDS